MGIKKRIEITLHSQAVFQSTGPPPAYQGHSYFLLKASEQGIQVLVNTVDLGVRFLLSPLARPHQGMWKPLNLSMSVFSRVK